MFLFLWSPLMNHSIQRMEKARITFYHQKANRESFWLIYYDESQKIFVHSWQVTDRCTFLFLMAQSSLVVTTREILFILFYRLSHFPRLTLFLKTSKHSTTSLRIIQALQYYCDLHSDCLVWRRQSFLLSILHWKAQVFTYKLTPILKILPLLKLHWLICLSQQWS